MKGIFGSTQNTRPILADSLKLIRSDVPTEVTEDERQWLIDNRITNIVDLRTDEERARKRCPLAEDKRFCYHAMPVRGGNAIPKTVSDVSKSYISMVDESLEKTIETILTSDTGTLYFCNAGKDRTGVVSAILLFRLGLNREYIASDYMKSKNNLKDMLQSFARQNPSVDINVITPHESYINEFLDWYIENSR